MSLVHAPICIDSRVALEFRPLWIELEALCRMTLMHLPG